MAGAIYRHNAKGKQRIKGKAEVTVASQLMRAADIQSHSEGRIHLHCLGTVLHLACMRRRGAYCTDATYDICIHVYVPCPTWLSQPHYPPVLPAIENWRVQGPF